MEVNNNAAYSPYQYGLMGLNQAQEQLNQASVKATDPKANTAEALIETKMAERQFETGVQVLKTEDQMQQRLVDLFA